MGATGVGPSPSVLGGQGGVFAPDTHSPHPTVPPSVVDFKKFSPPQLKLALILIIILILA